MLPLKLLENVNLVSFEKNRIEISFNDRLDKNFVKDLSLKLFEWTNERWIITLSKIKGNMSIKEKEKDEKNKLFDKGKAVVPENVQHRKLDDIKPGGLGTFFIKQIMDAAVFKKDQKGWVNHLILTKKI